MLKRIFINRLDEKRLLFAATLILAGGLWLAYKALLDRNTVSPVLPAVILAFSFWLTHFILCIKDCRGDQLILPLVFFLSGIGWIEVFRLEPALMMKQFYWILLGLAVFVSWILLYRDYRWIEEFKYFSLLLAVILQVLVMIFGVEINNARLWFKFGSVYFQPIEVVKILLVFFLAGYLRQYKELLGSVPGQRRTFLNIKYLAPLILMLGASLLILVYQKDMGMALLLFGTFLTLLYIATRRLDYILGGLSFFAAGAFLCSKLFYHVRVRVDMWLNPWQDLYDRGYQITQSLYAIASGGLFGTGLGLGSPGYIPAVHTDFVFASICEELGFLGGAAIILFYIFLIGRAFSSALKAKDEFGQLLGAGLAIILALQSFIIIAGVTRLIPMTGITMPFVSYGGSSLLANFFMCAILMQISDGASR
ncbi:MAG: FtsW/RodA/SpoVE family cell cycle protein [Firmicutes bacterium]|nr:FtsW/RodA/SpoVE family cell cycle protein [Bacillota bacterium]